MENRAPDNSKSGKEDANYRAMEKCSLCVTFYPPNSCSEVEGNISADAVCNKFSLKESSKPWDKEFYAKEFQQKEQ